MRNRRQVVVAARCDHETQGLLIKTDAARWPIERWNHGLIQQPGRGFARMILSGAGPSFPFFISSFLIMLVMCKSRGNRDMAGIGLAMANRIYS